MITSNPSSRRSTTSRTAVLALAFAFSLALASAPVAQAADMAAPAAAATALPLTPSFKKVKDEQKGPYVLHLKNDSKEAIKATAKIHQSVVVHSDSKERDIPAHTVAAGKSWIISHLAAGDKVVITAAGFAPLELTVP